MSLQIFKLEKLTIEAFTTVVRDKPIPAPKVFEAMFNPTELKWSFGIEASMRAAINKSAGPAQYQYTHPETLSLKLYLDGTHVEYTLLERTYLKVASGQPFFSSVRERLNAFRHVAYQYKSDIHEPPHLCLKWGAAIGQFNCRLRSYEVTYTLFDRDGTPLRAELDIKFIADPKPNEVALTENKQSPDMTHARTVRAGDTLPMLTAAIYGSAEHYLDVARYNDLDNFRSLSPGQQLLFPPLAVFSTNASARGSES